MVTVKILLRANPTTSTWVRYHGLSIDEPLYRNFWETQPDKVIKVTRSAVYYDQFIELPEGQHYLIYRNSEYTLDKPWRVNVAVNDSLIAENELVTIDTPLQGSFIVGEIPDGNGNGNGPPMPPPIRSLAWLAILLSFAVGGVLSFASKKR